MDHDFAMRHDLFLPFKIPIQHTDTVWKSRMVYPKFQTWQADGRFWEAQSPTCMSRWCTASSAAVHHLQQAFQVSGMAIAVLVGHFEKKS